MQQENVRDFQLLLENPSLKFKARTILRIPTNCSKWKLKELTQTQTACDIQSIESISSETSDASIASDESEASDTSNIDHVSHGSKHKGSGSYVSDLEHVGHVANNNEISEDAEEQEQEEEEEPNTPVLMECDLRGAPDDELPEGRPWPPGWIKSVQVRKSGTTKGLKDKYWYSPEKEYKFRNINEVVRFLDALENSGGDEEKAWKVFRMLA